MRHAAPGEQTLYSPGPDFRTLHSTLDLKKANELLDKLGLDKKDSEGFRLRTDNGQRLSLEVITYLGFLQFTQILEMVRDQWKRIGIIHTAIAYTDESIELFVARKLTHVGEKLDQGEFLETLTVPFDEAIAMIRDGRITDAKTVAALLLVKDAG